VEANQAGNLVENQTDEVHDKVFGEVLDKVLDEVGPPASGQVCAGLSGIRGGTWHSQDGCAKAQGERLGSEIDRSTYNVQRSRFNGRSPWTRHGGLGGARDGKERESLFGG
jgi:hypothetical protein